MRWYVQVLMQGEPEPSNMCVEAPSWQAALAMGRRLRGEGDLRGLGIEVLPTGCTAFDPVARTRYVVERAPKDAPLSFTSPAPMVASRAGAQAPLARRKPAAAARKKKTPIAGSRTMIISSQGAAELRAQAELRGDPTPPRQPARRPVGNRPRVETMDGLAGMSAEALPAAGGASPQPAQDPQRATMAWDASTRQTSLRQQIQAAAEQQKQKDQLRSTVAWDAVAAPNAEGIRQAPGPQDGQRRVSWDASVVGAVTRAKAEAEARRRSRANTAKNPQSVPLGGQRQTVGWDASAVGAMTRAQALEEGRKTVAWDSTGAPAGPEARGAVRQVAAPPRQPESYETAEDFSPEPSRMPIMPPPGKVIDDDEAPPLPSREIARKLLSERTLSPTKELPLHYCELVYGVGGSPALTQIETFVHKELNRVCAELSDFPRGKAVNIAVFDHIPDDQPLSPPVVLCQWKDWRGEEPTVVFFPFAEQSYQSAAEAQAALESAAAMGPASEAGSRPKARPSFAAARTLEIPPKPNE